MAAVQERLKLKRVPIDTWTTKERLCLASSVLRSGDQNWVSVSRSLRAFGEPSRPVDWFSQKNCALQYASLLEKVDTPKRKRGDKGEVHLETAGECIVRKLTLERVEELKKLIQQEKRTYLKLKDEICVVRSGQVDDKLNDICQQIEEEKKQKEREHEAHIQWLKEREEKKQEIQRLIKTPVLSLSARKKVNRNANRRNSSQSEPSSEAESAVDSPLSEPLNVDIVGDESMEGQVEPKPAPTPTSPLLTSLLQSPSQNASSQASSILHSAITSQRGSSPTITSLLNSSPGIPVSTTVSSVSPGLKNLVSTAISSASEEHQKPHTTSPSSGAPTLSMLLELPPSVPGKPLPEIPAIMKAATPTVPAEKRLEPVPDKKTLPLPTVTSKEETILDSLLNPKTETPTLVTSVNITHPQHEEIKVQKEIESDEVVEVVEVDRIDIPGRKEADSRDVKELIPASAIVVNVQEEVISTQGEECAETRAVQEDSVTSEQKEDEQDSLEVVPDEGLTEVMIEVVKLDDKGLEEVAVIDIPMEEIEAVEEFSEKVEERDSSVKEEPKEEDEKQVAYNEASVAENVSKEELDDEPSEAEAKKSEEQTRKAESKGNPEEVASTEIAGDDDSSLELRLENEEEDSKESGAAEETLDEEKSDAAEENKVVKEDEGNSNETEECEDPQADTASEQSSQDMEPEDRKADLESLVMQEEGGKASTKAKEEEMKDVKVEVKEEKPEKQRRSEKREKSDRGSRAASPFLDDDKTSDVDTPRTSGRKKAIVYSAPGTPIDSVPNSPASGIMLSDEEREYRAWKKAIMLVWGRLATHKYASIFLRPITDDQAPGYHSVVYRPVDLAQIKKNIETGVIRTTVEFQRDVMLMFLNAIMYNSSDHDVHIMAKRMQQEGMQHIQDFLNTQMLVQTSETPKSLRRETREASKKTDVDEVADVPETKGGKRKRTATVSSSEEKGAKKRKCED